jgi:hypothetical protein
VPLLRTAYTDTNAAAHTLGYTYGNSNSNTSNNADANSYGYSYTQGNSAGSPDPASAPDAAMIAGLWPVQLSLAFRAGRRPIGPWLQHVPFT